MTLSREAKNHDIDICHGSVQKVRMRKTTVREPRVMICFFVVDVMVFDFNSKFQISKWLEEGIVNMEGGIKA